MFELAVEIAAKVALGIALLGAPTQHHPGHTMPVSAGVVATPSPTPQAELPVQNYTGGALTAGQVASYVRAAGFPESLVDDMVAIAWRESTFCPTAVNPGHCPGLFIEGGPACSLFQLNPCPGPEAADPMAAAWFAREKCLRYMAAGRGCLDPWGGAP